MEVHSSESKIAKQGDYLFYTYNGEIYLVAYIGDGEDISLPETYNGQNYCIYEYAFYACTSLVSVTIPDGVVSIGLGAFKDCSSLESMTIPFAGANPYASGYEAHFGYIFGYSCQKVYEDPSGYGRPDFYHYLNCYSYEYEPGYWYEYYEYYTYYIPESLKTVTVTGEVSGNAFENCTSLENVIIGNGVSTIGNYAFYNCTSLTSMTIGNGVTTIDSYAFYNCTSLRSIKYRGTEDEWNTISKESDWDYNTGGYTITYNYTGE